MDFVSMSSELVLTIECYSRPGGVQREGEGRTNIQGEVENLTLAGQCLAEVHALGDQGGVNFNHCSHFGLTSELVKN